ncbi:MAG: Tetratricopeptide repeat [Abditibacteriota bacterium]|nr:Tetratricopeptide repeat [Abditibacteriota bacterium]
MTRRTKKTQSPAAEVSAIKAIRTKATTPEAAPVESVTAEGVAVEPVTVATWQALAQVAAEGTRWKEAAHALENAAQLAPHDVELWIQIARWQRAGDEREAAQSTLKRAIACNSDAESLILLRLALAELLFEAQDWSACILVCRDVLAVRPDQHFALEMLATSLLHSDQTEVAMDVLRRLLQVSPRDPLHRLRYATLLQVQGQTGQALQEWERIVALYPDSPFSEEAEDAIEMLDRTQIQHILLRAAEQSSFGWQLQRDLDGVLSEHEIYLSEAGRETLRQIVWDGRAEDASPPPTPRVH